MPEVAGMRPTQQYSSFLDRIHIDGLEMPSIHEYETTDPNLWENARKDPKIRHAIDYGLDLATGDGYNLRPGGNNKADHLKKDFIQAVVENLNHYHKSMWAMMTHRFFGVSYAYVKAKPGYLKLPDGRQIYVEYLPYKIQNIDKDRVKVTWKNNKEFREVSSLSTKKWIPLDTRATMILTNSNLERNAGQGDPLLQPISWAHYCIKRVEKSALQLIERFANGFMIIKVNKTSTSGPGKSIEELQAEYIEVVPKARANKFLTMRGEDEIQILEPNGQGVQIVQWLLTHYYQAIQIIAIGSNLPVEASGTTGSFALAQVQENSNFYNILKTRKEGESAMNDQFIPLTCNENKRLLKALGIWDANDPIFEIRDPQKQQPEAAANSIEIATKAGMPLDDSDTREKLNLKEADPESGKVIEPMQQPGMQDPQEEEPEYEELELEEAI